MFLSINNMHKYVDKTEFLKLSKRRPDNLCHKREHNLLFAINAFGRILYIDSTLFETTRILLEHKHHPNNLIAVSCTFKQSDEKKSYDTIQIYPQKINDCISEILRQPIHSSYLDSHNSLHESKSSIGNVITHLLRQDIDQQLIAMTTAYVPRNIHKNISIDEVIQTNFSWLQARFNENQWIIECHYIRQYPGTRNTKMIFQMFRLQRCVSDPSNQMSWQPTQ